MEKRGRVELRNFLEENFRQKKEMDGVTIQ